MFKKAKKNKKGFTLAEMLIVVAIIAVLVAISIPIFTSQLEKSREATDLANIRAAYAEIMASALDNPEDTNLKKEVDMKQVVAGWATTSATKTLQELAGNTDYVTMEDANTVGKCTLTWVPATDTVDGHITIVFGAKTV